MTGYMRYLILVFYIFYTTNGLRWTKSGYTDNKDTVIATSTAKSNPEIDVSNGVQVIIIRNTRDFERGFTIFCFVSGTNDKVATSFEFCNQDKTCYTVNDQNSLSDVDFVNFKINFERNFPGKIGLKILLKLSDLNMDYSGNYYCQATNGAMSIVSNYIEIRDVHYWGLNLFSTIVTSQKTDIQVISKSSLPQVLNCSNGASVLRANAPPWTKIEFSSPTFWSVCPVIRAEQGLSEMNKMTTNKCLTYTKDKCNYQINSAICPVDLRDMSEWSTFTNQNGDLVFTDIKQSSRGNIDSFSLMCYAKDKDGSLKALFYFLSIASGNEITKGITFDDTKSNPSQPLQMISPKVQEFTLYARRLPQPVDPTLLRPMTIYGLFTSSDDAQWVWKIGNTKLNTNNNLRVNKYSLTFAGDITTEMAGKYSLEVTDKTSNIVMEMNVRVLGGPVLVAESCMAPLNYLWEGEDLRIECKYKQRPSDIKLKINSQTVNLNDSPENSKALLKKVYPYLEMLNFTVSPRDYVETDTVTLVYSVYNVTQSLGQVQYQDHIVTFLATNDLGQSVKLSSIYVVPRLETIVTQFPEKNNCTEMCSSKEMHTFHCEVQTQKYANKELNIDHYWTINSNRLGPSVNNEVNMFTPYFQVDPVTKMLTMLPIVSNNTKQDKQVKDTLKNNNIECHVDLIPTNKDESTFRFLSTLDSSLSRRMKARITLDYLPLSNAYIYWIMAVILGLLVLIILLILVATHCLKNKGATYQLDKLERKHGYDPEKEVQDEMFKPYERQEHDPGMVHSDDDDRKLSISGNSVGSNDDGELDGYGIDASNFNEDGSIIGKYGANPRNRAAMT